MASRIFSNWLSDHTPGWRATCWTLWAKQYELNKEIVEIVPHLNRLDSTSWENTCQIIQEWGPVQMHQSLETAKKTKQKKTHSAHSRIPVEALEKAGKQTLRCFSFSKSPLTSGDCCSCQWWGAFTPKVCVVHMDLALLIDQEVLCLTRCQVYFNPSCHDEKKKKKLTRTPGKTQINCPESQVNHINLLD